MNNASNKFVGKHKASTSTMFCKVCKDAGKLNFTDHNVKEKNKLTGELVTVCPTLLSTECRFCYEKGHIAKYCPVLKKEDDLRTTTSETKSKPVVVKANPIQEKKTQSIFAAAFGGDSSDDDDDENNSCKAVTTKKRQQEDKNEEEPMAKKAKTDKHVTFDDQLAKKSSIVERKTYDTEFPTMMSAAATPAPRSNKPVTKEGIISFAAVASKTKEEVDEKKLHDAHKQVNDDWAVLLDTAKITKNISPKVTTTFSGPSPEMKQYFKKIARSWADDSSDEEDEEN